MSAPAPEEAVESSVSDAVSTGPVAFALAQVLHRSGAPVWPAEGGVERLGLALGLPMACMATPTGVFVQVNDELKVLRMHPGGIDLAAKVEAELALSAFEAGALSPAALAERLLALLRPRPPRALPEGGVGIDDPEGILKWLAPDRATVDFSSAADLQAKLPALLAVLRQWLRTV